MLFIPLIVSLPIGIFLHALGLSVIKPVENSGYGSDNVSGGNSVDITRVGLAAFGLVLAQGVMVGIIFGIITAKIKKLHITNKRKGITLGLATGVIACLVLYVSVILTIYPSLLANALTRYTQTLFITRIAYACNYNSITKLLPIYITWLWLVCLFGIRLYPRRNISLGKFAV
jgi:hypothetical protein